jgi:mRNA-degrading endonuclease RelE of RelBE toxin-antitoxin system
MVRIKLTDTAIRQYQKLTTSLQRKADKQFEHLLSNIRHPSLHAKKYKGSDDLWQARIDKDWRFYFFIIDPSYIIVSIIKHPK